MDWTDICFMGIYIYCLSMLMADLFFVCHMREIVGGMFKCMDTPISFIFFKPLLSVSCFKTRCCYRYLLGDFESGIHFLLLFLFYF